MFINTTKYWNNISDVDTDIIFPKGIVWSFYVMWFCHKVVWTVDTIWAVTSVTEKRKKTKPAEVFVQAKLTVSQKKAHIILVGGSLYFNNFLGSKQLKKLHTGFKEHYIHK